MNNVRLSKGSEESAPKEIKSGDIVQFGVDVVENSKKGLLMTLFIVPLHYTSPGRLIWNTKPASGSSIFSDIEKYKS